MTTTALVVQEEYVEVFVLVWESVFSVYCPICQPAGAYKCLLVKGSETRCVVCELCVDSVAEMLVGVVG